MSSMICRRIRQMSTRLMTTISMGSKPQQSSRRLTGHGLCISTETPHHWQYWVLINDEPKEGTILIEMPYPYIIEMICDWWAFSWIKGDLSEMFAWYKDHADYIKMHNNTRSIVEEILEMIWTKLTEVENAEN